ncbi:ABC transporter substrate-binding protein [Paenibacillus beijingensis]|uniref:ABC transporter substrate-binding protein n=1 Tax=Paenibacillus beijingensis TaxID=1126833 RepID=A0A0D5NLA6_9BACL|nr:ABC transporter substrate-binding protein [Paenibacillus beijingensis]AJY75930.1 ABC transporter substrate-binding protein [Paenibacillus beijingensis]
MKPIVNTKMFFTALTIALVVLVLSACGGNTATSGNNEKPSTDTAASNTNAKSGNESTAELVKSEPGGKKEGGSVVVNIPQDLDYLDPQLAVAAGTSEVLFNVFEGLLKPNEKGELYPAVAESYDVSPDGLTYTFKLRGGVKFHNGQTVTSADVKFSYDRLAGTGTGKPLNPAFGSVQSIEAPDASTVIIKLKENNSSFLTALTAAIIPSGYEDSNKNPIGTGPFKFKEYLPGQRLVVEKFADYYVKGVPSLDQVEFRIITDPEASLLALKSGEADIYPRIGTEKLEELGDKFTALSAPQNLVQLMTFNIDRKPFNDIRVRQAINYAVDKDEIIQGVALGKGTKLGSNLSPVLAKYYQEGLENTYAPDIEKAKSLLLEAGFKDGFETTLSVPSNYQFHVDTAQVIAQQLEKIGIKVKIEPVEWAVWLDRIYKGRDYDLTIIGLDGKLNPYDILNKYLSDAPNNFFNYKNTTFDQTLKAAVTEVDDAKRVDLYKKAQTILTQDAAAVYIMDPNLNVALNKKLAGYKQYPLYVQDLSTVYFTE